MVNAEPLKPQVLIPIKDHIDHGRLAQGVAVI